VAALALPVAPALAGEDDTSPTPAPTNPTGPVPDAATLHASSSCVSGHRVTATVAGTNVAKAVFYIDGKHITTVTKPSAGGGYSVSMSCTHLRVGSNRARAVVTFTQGAHQTLSFQVTRQRRASPRFTG
jgi:hypothetical protein